MGSGLDASMTGSGRLEVILIGAIVVLAVVLLLYRFLRSSNHRRRKGASTYFDKNAADRSRSDSDASTGTAVYPTTRPAMPQPMAPTLAAPRRGTSQKDAGAKQGRSEPMTPPDPSRSLRSPGTAPAPPPFFPPMPAPGMPPRATPPVSSPVLDPTPPLLAEGVIMPPDLRSAAPNAGTTPGPPASRRTAVPANLPPLAPPPSTDEPPTRSTVGEAGSEGGSSRDAENDPTSESESGDTPGP